VSKPRQVNARLEKIMRFAFWMASFRLTEPTWADVCERFAISRSTAFRWLAIARTARGG